MNVRVVAFYLRKTETYLPLQRGWRLRQSLFTLGRFLVPLVVRENASYSVSIFNKTNKTSICLSYLLRIKGGFKGQETPRTFITEEVCQKIKLIQVFSKNSIATGRQTYDTELVKGIEPPTPILQVWCTTVVLHQHIERVLIGSTHNSTSTDKAFGPRYRRCLYSPC